jgi:hypothetical protein
LKERIKTLVAIFLAQQARRPPTSSGYTNNLGRLRSLGLIDYPQRGQVDATPTLSLEGCGNADKRDAIARKPR